MVFFLKIISIALLIAGWLKFQETFNELTHGHNDHPFLHANRKGRVFGREYLSIEKSAEIERRQEDARAFFIMAQEMQNDAELRRSFANFSARQAAQMNAIDSYNRRRIANPHKVNYNQTGPSLDYLDYFVFAHRNPNIEEQIIIVELQLFNQFYSDAYSNAMKLTPAALPEPLRIRWYNAVMELCIMMGRTENAVSTFAECQPFADSYLINGGNGIHQYLDNASMICALSGDFEEAKKYVDALQNLTDNDMIINTADLIPRITRVKILFLMGSKENAEAGYATVFDMIDTFPNYEYVWQRDYFHTLLERARLFDITQLNDDNKTPDMPSI